MVIEKKRRGRNRRGRKRRRKMTHHRKTTLVPWKRQLLPSLMTPALSQEPKWGQEKNDSHGLFSNLHTRAAV